MRYVVTGEEMRALDAATIEDIGLPGAVLMENAGRAVTEAVVELVQPRGHVAVVCGAGNNGGDGYVIARCLRERGISATVYMVAPRDAIGGDADLHLRVYEQCGGVAVSIADKSALSEHAPAIEAADVVVDCVFGTGLTREVVGHYRAVIELINRSGRKTLAVDIPSGLASDTGQVLGIAVAADMTVTMAFLKVALAVAPGFAYCGDVRVAEIGIPYELAQAQGIRLAMLDANDLAPLLSPLHPLDYKGRRGHLLVVAGSPGKRGAGRLTAWSGMRTGAGLVTLAAAGADLSAHDPVMTVELDADASGADAALKSLAAGKRAVAMGPGMATTDGGAALVRAALAALDCPLVLDADALNHIGTDLAVVANSQPPVILTPHPGEAARLLGCTTADIERDRIAAVRNLAEASRAVVVLKGARTLVCDGIADVGFVTINPSGGPELATAGSGDVLTGAIAALTTQGIAPGEAARLGAFVHGIAGEIAAAELGARSVTASDVAEAIPAALQRLDR